MASLGHGAGGMTAPTPVTVVGVATVVDRATGADEVIGALGVPYRSLLGLTDLGLA